MQDKRARARGKLRGVSPGATLQTAIRPCFRARGWTGGGDEKGRGKWRKGLSRNLRKGGIRRKTDFELHRDWALNAGGVMGVAARHIQDMSIGSCTICHVSPTCFRMRSSKML